jgi:hypothetical protein
MSCRRPLPFIVAHPTGCGVGVAGITTIITTHTTCPVRPVVFA